MRSKTKQLVYTAMLIALGVIVPMGFHMVGAGGPIFLPMHIPVFIAGIMVGPWYGMLVGILAPVLSSLTTGMPPLLPMLPIMMVELALYGLVMGLFRTRKPIQLGLITSMVMGRIGAGFTVWVMVSLFNMTNLPANPLVFVWGSIVTGLPGIVIQIILITLLNPYLRRELKDVKRVLQ